MVSVPRFQCVSLVLALVLVSSAWVSRTYLDKEPERFIISTGEVVYVDDGSCPKGQVKEVTGGSAQRNIPRKYRCVPR